MIYQKLKAYITNNAYITVYFIMLRGDITQW